MSGALHLRFSLASMLAMLLTFGPAALTMAAQTSRFEQVPHEPPETDFSTPTCPTGSSAVADVAQTVQRLCGGAPIEEALLTVRLQPGEAADSAGRALAGLGLRTALDLQLMQAAGPEVTELLDALTLAGVSLGDRVKIRLLVGDRVLHLGRLTSADAAQHLVGGRPANPQPQQGEGSADDDSAAGGAAAAQERRLQADPADNKATSADGGGGMSMDTIAIVLTVLVGTAGYIVQAFTARRAERSAAEEADKFLTVPLNNPAFCAINFTKDPATNQLSISSDRSCAVVPRYQPCRGTAGSRSG